MPVTLLYVEGDLDEELLSSVFAGAPAVQKQGSKYALKSIVVSERKKSGNRNVEFLRDRDFDSEPDVAYPHRPTPILTPNSGERFGWSWFRHSIESYLLEPRLAARALEKAENVIEELLSQAPGEIACYEAARWTVGQARSKLPPMRQLETRPNAGSEFNLPTDISENANWAWISSTIRNFIQPVSNAFQEENLRQKFDNYKERFSNLSVSEILVWFSGKDLLGFMAAKIGNTSGSELRNRLRDWVREHPDETITLLPEWAELRRLLSE